MKCTTGLACILIATAVADRALIGQQSTQQAEVSVRVSVEGTQPKGRTTAISAGYPVVIWLVPLDRPESPARLVQTYRMVQRNKQFIPHLLIVPVGSTIDFPNEDPLFHNVFSLFNGRRFDLGLYQAGESRAIRFDREGVSYIFCNIHPEMGGIIVSLATPYYSSSATGVATLHSVPPGSYMLHVWSERASLEGTRAATQRVTLHSGANDLGQIVLQAAPATSHDHKNMYGQDYGSRP
jgi:plastocyanin